MKRANRFGLLLALLALPIGAGFGPTTGATSMAAPPAATTVKPDEVGLSAARLQRLTAMIERRVAAGEVAGAVVAIARKGKLAHVSAHGVTDLESKQPIGPASMFRIASMTKPIIGAAILMLVEEGRLRLNDPVSRYIPEFREMKVAVATPGSGPPAAGAELSFTTTPAQRQITIKDLLTHASGLGSGPMSAADIAKVARKDGETLADYIPRLGRTVLEFQPGSQWSYSPGAGFETLGRVVEIASGMPLDRFLRTRIFDPLAMKDITFWPTDAQWPRVATVYTRPQNSGLTKVVMPNDTMSRNVYFRGSGGLYSTAVDYIPFGMMLANGGELNGVRVLSRKAVELMTAVHVPDSMAGRQQPGEGFGLSVRVVNNHAARNTMLSNGTFGWSGAQGTHFFVDPKERLVAVLMVQTSIQELMRDFEEMVAQSIAD